MNTPYFKYNAAIVKRSVAHYLKAFPKKSLFSIYYAVKANPYKKLIKYLVSKGFGLDIASSAELKHVLALGADPKKVVFASPTKIEKEVIFARDKGVEIQMVDTLEGAMVVKKVYGKMKYKLVLRIEGHGAKAVFDQSSIFGMPEDRALGFINDCKKEEIDVYGVTIHVGSQNYDLDAWNNASNTVKLLIRAGRKLGHSMKFVDFGGGIPAKYNKDSLRLSTYLKAIRSLGDELNKIFNNSLTFAVEPGRSIAAGSMDLYTTIQDIKEYKKPSVVIVDTSIFSGLIEAAYNLYYPIALNRKSSAKKKEYIIGGITCDGCDIINKSCLLPRNIKKGDVLKISMAGSYTISWKKVHLRDWPKVV